MKRFITTTIVLCFGLYIYSQTEANPFSKYGYDVLTATSSHGEFEEFHDMKDIVEIGTLLYNTKTKEIVGFTDPKEDIASSTTAMSIDPHCERYYWISPYAYCANNPIKFVDPDGRDYKIFYSQGGKNYSFIFNGSNYDAAPKNGFVQNVLTAYQYNTSNGGGESMKALAEAGPDKRVNVVESKYGDNSHSKGTVFWTSDVAHNTGDGQVYSPATTLEHEMAHALSYLTNSEQHSARRNTPDSQYHTAEERRVITGPEATTAQKNGEFPAGYARPDHNDHGGFKVNSPTSITPIPPAQPQTQQNSSIWQRVKDWVYK